MARRVSTSFWNSARASTVASIFGSIDRPPFIQLDADDRSGRSQGGENLHINLAHLDDFVRILIFAYIYEGTPNWASANGVVTLFPPGGPEVEVHLDNPDRRAISCAIAQLHVVNGELTVTREVQYIHGSQRAVAEAYLKFLGDKVPSEVHEEFAALRKRIEDAL